MRRNYHIRLFFAMPLECWLSAAPELYFSREPTVDPARDLIFHGYRLERNVLSEANAACRLPAVLCEALNTVEVDSTFYACPTARTVSNWASRTPEGFVFSVKVPQVITHEKVLRDCDADLKQFLDTMDILGKKLGPIVFRFPFFSRSAFRDRHEFLGRLVPFLRGLPDSHKFAIEIRNKTWLDSTLSLRAFSAITELRSFSRIAP